MGDALDASLALVSNTAVDGVCEVVVMRPSLASPIESAITLQRGARLRPPLLAVLAT